MARINTLIDKVKDPQLRQLLLAEVSDIKKQKKFGLVFEEHVPEATPLYELPIVSGCLVSERDKQFVNYYLVERVDGDDVFCVTQDENHDKVTFRKGDIVRVALFGQPIYPSLQPNIFCKSWEVVMMKTGNGKSAITIMMWMMRER